MSNLTQAKCHYAEKVEIYIKPTTLKIKTRRWNNEKIRSPSVAGCIAVLTCL